MDCSFVYGQPLHRLSLRYSANTQTNKPPGGGNNTVILPIMLHHVNSAVTGLLSQQPCKASFPVIAKTGSQLAASACI